MGWREEPERTTPCSIVINSSNLFELTSKMTRVARRKLAKEKRNYCETSSFSDPPKNKITENDLPYLFTNNKNKKN